MSIKVVVLSVRTTASLLLMSVFVLKFADAALAQNAQKTKATKSPSAFNPSADIDERLGEKIQPGELEAAPKIAEAMKAQIIKARADGAVDEKGNPVFMRAAHPKAHCCITARFKIRKDVPDDLQAGLFAKSGKSYRAWIRYSNSNANVRDDKSPDARGMAIKLTGVKGPKIDADLPERSTQDFILLSGPTFFVDDPLTYLKVFTEGPQSLPAENLKLAGILASSHQKSLLNEVYWSQTPYRLGNGRKAQAVKYAAIPVSCASSEIPAERVGQQELFSKIRSANRLVPPGGKVPESYTNNYLRETLVQELGAADACFVFGVQRFVDAEKTPIENSRVNWDDYSAFIPVADIRIPKQTFDSAAQNTFCQNLSFSPWHAGIEHKPLGGVNRIRFIAYKVISEARRAGNNVSGNELRGPTGREKF